MYRDKITAQDTRYVLESMSSIPSGGNLHTASTISTTTNALVNVDDCFILGIRLEQLLNGLLSPNQQQREDAEFRIQQHQKDSKFLSLLISYACTGTAAVTPLSDPPSPSTVSSLASEGVIAGSPRLSFTAEEQPLSSNSSSSSSSSSSSPIFVDPTLYSHLSQEGGAAFVDELDSRDSSLLSPTLSSTECIARRALAAVVAKRMIRLEWTSNSCCFSQEVKDDIKDILVQHLVNLPSTVRPTIHLIVATIAYQEGRQSCLHQAWPSLIPTLRYQLDQCRHHGGCGEKYQGDKGHRTILITTAILDLLMVMADPDHKSQTLARDLLNPDYGIQDGLLFLAQGMKQLNIAQKKEVVTIRAECRRKCIDVFRLCVKGVLGYAQQSDAMSDDIDLVLLYLAQWCNVIQGLVSEVADTPTDLGAMQVALASLKCLSSFFVSRCGAFETIAFPCLGVTVQKCLEVLTVLYPCYENMTINDSDGVSAIEEDAEGGPTSLIVQFCRLLTLCTSRPVLCRGIVEGHVQDLLAVLMKFMQITELQKERWLSDANEYLTQEEEYYQLELSVRQSGRELLNGLLNCCYRETTDDLIQSAIALFEATDDTPKEDDTDSQTNRWWKFLELIFWVMGLIVEKEAFKTIQNRPEFEIVVFRIGGAVGNKNCPALLRARALLTATKLSKFLFEKYPNDMEKLLLISAEALHRDEPPPVRVAALKAFSVFLSRCPRDKCEAVIKTSNVLEHLDHFMTIIAIEDSLSLALDVFKQIFTVCPSAVLATEDSIISKILAKWRECSNNPLSNVHFLELFRAACSSSARLRESIYHHLFPSIIKSLTESVKNPNRVDYHQLEISLDLYTLLLRVTPKPLLDSLWEGFNWVMLLLLRMEEAAAVQTACECFTLLLIQFETKIKEQQTKIKGILQVAEHLLSSDLDDHAAMMAGPLLQVFIRLFSESLPADLIRQIFSAMLRRMITAELPALQESIMVVFSCFVCSTSEPMLAVLESIRVPMEGSSVDTSQSLSGLLVLVTFWIQWLRKVKGQLRSTYVRNVTYSAILSVLQHRRRELLAFSPSTENVVTELLTLLIHEVTDGETDRKSQPQARLRRRKSLTDQEGNCRSLDSPSVESPNGMDGNSNGEEWEEEDLKSSSDVEVLSDSDDGQRYVNALDDTTTNLGVFAVAGEEDKAGLRQLDMKNILLETLSEMCSLAEYASSFAQVDPRTLELWDAFCQTTFTPELASNAIEGGTASTEETS